MLFLAAHNHHHVLPTIFGLLAFFASLGLGGYLIVTPADSETRCAIFRRRERRSHRTVAALAALSFAAMSSALLKAESDTWWHRRCDSHKPGCGGAPPLVPFTARPSD